MPVRACSEIVGSFGSLGALMSWLATIELQLIVAQLDVVEEIERCVRHIFVLWSVTKVKVTITIVKPQKRIAFTVKRQELQLVGGMHKIVAGLNIFLRRRWIGCGAPGSAKVLLT
jgi:hypothetical protein